jgi:hypothetical protein
MQLRIRIRIQLFTLLWIQNPDPASPNADPCGSGSAALTCTYNILVLPIAVPSTFNIFIIMYFGAFFLDNVIDSREHLAYSKVMTYDKLKKYMFFHGQIK